MSNAIDLLERIGKDANLRYASAPDLATALDGSEASTVRSMLAAKNASTLHEILGAKPNVFCGIAPASYEDGSGAPHPERKTA